jgi:predicted alpha/beta hydrolase family esterase
VPRRPTRFVPVVVLHGWNGSGPDHWQTWLVDQLRELDRDVRYPEFPKPDAPDLDTWSAALRGFLEGLPDDGFDVVCHSLASVLWLHHVADPTPAPRPARVALVSPPSPLTSFPEVAGFFPPPLDIDALRRAADGTVLVGGDNDPYCSEGLIEAYGRPLKIATTLVPDGGHLNSDSGFGPWPAVLDWCGRDNLAFF